MPLIHITMVNSRKCSSLTMLKTGQMFQVYCDTGLSDNRLKKLCSFLQGALNLDSNLHLIYYN